MNNSEKNRVLIVDDEKSNLEVLFSILSHDYTILTAKSGTVAIDIASKYLPDIVLLDIIMPDMNGFDVLAALKASAKTKNIPVIFITGLDGVEDEEKGLDLEASDFIHKPFSPKIVKSRVRNQIQIINQIRELVALHKDLEAAVKTAESANKTKSAFLAKMSHEIRTPMNAILGISEIQLQNKSLFPDVMEAFSRIYNSGELLLGIINDILDMSKIEAGKLKLTHKNYDVARMINDTVILNKIKYEAKPIEFIINVNEDIPSELFGDELRIKQILNNLLSNAFKYTASGEVELSVNRENTNDIADDTTTLIFRVRDTGQGMTEEQVEKLFDDYSRFNMEANRTTEGIGLGMGITKSLIDMMNGEILVESKRGSGSLFTVRLPQGKISAPPLGKEATEKLKLFRSNYENKTEKTKIVYEQLPFAKILVVDDMEMNLYVAKGMLSPYGLQIDTALSGFDAIEKIKHKTYDLVFMDHMMPRMDGIETTAKIRKLGEKYERLPIIALTANAVAGMKEMFLDNMFNGFISKPIAMQELNEVLKKWLLPLKAARMAVSVPAEMPEIQAAAANAGDDYNSFIDSVSTIDEINAEIGLGRFSDDKEMYYNTLYIFFMNIISECDNMTFFLETKDLNNFSISVHAMKSSLAIIGARQLSDAAFKLEAASKNDDIDYCEQQFPVLKESLLSIHKKLSEIFQSANALQQKEPGDMNCLKENVKKALAAADDFNNDTGIELIKKLLPYDFGGEVNILLENALAEFENFKYQNAAESLTKIKLSVE